MGKFRQTSTQLWPLIYFKISFPCSILSIFLPIFFKLCIEYISRRSGLGVKMGKFCQISTELWPLICIKNLFTDSILGIYRPIFFKLYIGVSIRNEWFGIEDG